MRLLTEKELEAWMQAQRWIYARTLPRHPHDYCLKRHQDSRLFEMVVYTIWERGYDRPYIGRPWRSLDIGDYYCWVCTLPTPLAPAPLRDTILINRAVRVQDTLL